MRTGAQISHTCIMPSGHVLAQAAQFALRFANELRLYNVIGVFGVLDQRSQRHSVPQVAGTGLGTDPCVGVAQLAADAGGDCCPSQRAISDLQATIREDRAWYPGKNKDLQDQGGRPNLFTPQKQQACANAAMAINGSTYKQQLVTWAKLEPNGYGKFDVLQLPSLKTFPPTCGLL
jgi:hypothetical protein